MANINRVVLVGNLTPLPRAPQHAERHLGLQAPHRREHAHEGRRDRPVDGQAELLRRHGLGRPGRELRAVPLKGRPVAVDGRLDWREWDAQDGTKRQAVEIIADSVQFLGGGRAEGEGQFVPAGAAENADFTPAATDDDIPF